MKFTCDKCGRSYVADEKVRERAFRMRCKQCGHQIVVKPAALPTPPPGTIPAITPLPFFLATPVPGELETISPEAAALESDSQPSPSQVLERLERDLAPAAVALPPPLPPRVAPPSGPPVLTPVATRSPIATPVPGRMPALAPEVPPPRPAAAAAATPQFSPPPAVPPPLPPAASLASPPALELEESSRPTEPDPFASMAAELSAELAGVPEAPPLAPPDPFLSAAPPPPPVAPKLSESEEAFADLGRMMEASGARPLHVNGDTVEQRKAARPTPVAEATRPEPAASGSTRRWAPIVGLGFGFGAIIAVGWLLASSGPVKKLAEPDRPAGAVPVAIPEPPAEQAARPMPPPPAQPVAPTPRAPEPAPAPAPPAPQARAAEAEVAVAPPAPPPPAPAAAPRAQKPRRESPPPRREPPRPVAEARPAPRPAPPPAVAAPPDLPRRSAPAPAPAPEPAAPARVSSPAAVAPGPTTSSSDKPLEDKDIEATIRRYAKAFEGCVSQARTAEPQLLADQRRVTVTMTVNPNGRALYPTLDDQELSATGLGACLKKEAGKMSFPEFGGEPVRVRVPLVLR